MFPANTTLSVSDHQIPLNSNGVTCSLLSSNLSCSLIQSNSRSCSCPVHACAQRNKQLSGQSSVLSHHAQNCLPRSTLLSTANNVPITAVRPSDNNNNNHNNNSSNSTTNFFQRFTNSGRSKTKL